MHLCSPLLICFANRKEDQQRTWLFHWLSMAWLMDIWNAFPLKILDKVSALNEAQCQISYHKGCITTNHPYFQIFWRKMLKLMAVHPCWNSRKSITCSIENTRLSWSRVALTFLSLQFVVQWLIFWRHYFLSDLFGKWMCRELVLHSPPQQGVSDILDRHYDRRT